MGLRVPKNKIKEGLYTSGNEFVEKDSYKPYKGYYYSMGGAFFSGKVFNIRAIEVIKNSSETVKVKSFDLNTLKYFYNASKSIQNILTSQTEVKGVNFTVTQAVIDKGSATRYFVKKQNASPILINEVNEENYNKLKNPVYIKVALLWKVLTGFNQNEINTLDKSNMVGIKTFLQDLNSDPIGSAD